MWVEPYAEPIAVSTQKSASDPSVRNPRRRDPRRRKPVYVEVVGAALRLHDLGYDAKKADPG